MEDWAEIRRLHRSEEMPIKAIVRKLGVSRNAVRRALAADAPPKYVRPPKGSAVDAVEPQIRALLTEWPTMPATVIAERIGWERSLTVLKDRVRRAAAAVPAAGPGVADELCGRASWRSATCGSRRSTSRSGAGQVGRPPVLVMVSGYSRWMSAVLLPSRQAPDLLAGHWQLLQRLGAVPRALVWDNEAAVGSWRAGRPEADRRVRGLPRDARDPGDPVPARATRRPRGWSSGPTAIWRRASCPAAPSPRRRTSTPSSSSGCSGRTAGSTGRWAAARSTGSRPTGRRCWRCRRSRRRSAGRARCGCRGTTTSGSTATTTPSTRPRSAGSSRSAPTCRP